MGTAGRALIREAFNIRIEAARLSALFCGYAAGSPPSDKRPEPRE